MPHQTTVIELSVEPIDLFPIVQDWARESEFSLYGKNVNKTYYSKDLAPGTRGWLSIEFIENKARIEVWQSGKNVGPEFEGNLWVGWKMPLPRGLLIGRARVFRNQVLKLIKILQGNAVVTTRVTTWNEAPPLRKSVLTKSLMFLGILSFAYGTLSLLTATNEVLRPPSPGLADAILKDGISGMIFGALVIVSSRAISRGKIGGLWLYVATILLDYAYRTAMGQKLNFLFLGISLFFIWQLFKSREEWGLSKTSVSDPASGG